MSLGCIYETRDFLFPPPTFLQNHICVLSILSNVKKMFFPISMLQRDFGVGKEVLSGTMQESHERGAMNSSLWNYTKI